MKMSTLNNTGLRVKFASILCAAVLVAAVAFCSIAYGASSVKVSGTDYYGTVASDEPIDVLTVTGNQGDTLYVDVYQDGTLVAKKYAWTLISDDGSAKAGVMQMSAKDLRNIDGYSLVVYSDEAETNLVGTWTLSAINAQLFDENGALVGTEVIGVRSLNSDGSENARVYTPSASMEIAGNTYAFKGVVDGVYQYRAYTPSQSVTGHITYVNEQGVEIAKQAIEGITSETASSSDPMAVTLKKVINVEGSDKSHTIYRAISNSDKVYAVYPGTTEFTVTCRAIASTKTAEGGFYVAKIRYWQVDDSGNKVGSTPLMVDTVSVYSKKVYTAPDYFYTRAFDESGTETVKEYELQSSAVITMDPLDTTGVSESGIKYFDVNYTAAIPGDTQTWVISLADGTTIDSATGKPKVLSTVEISVAAGETATYTPAKIDYNGTAYVPFNASELTYTYGGDPESTVYYVPEGYTPSESYEVTVNYVNIADNSVVSSQFVTISPDITEDVQIGPAPDTFDANGATWVKLAGQSSAISHGYYTPYRTYTVYYRDSNDSRYENTVITRVIPGTTTYTVVDNGTTTTGADGDGATTAGLADGDALIAGVDADGDGVLANEDGTTTQEEREIADDATPLASGTDLDSGNAIATYAPAIGVGIVAVAAIAIILFMLAKRKKKQEESEETAIQ